MTAHLGLDYAGGLPGAAAIKAAGYQFVVRYLTDGGPGLPGKLLTPAEYDDLQNHGIAVVVNSEPGVGTRMLAGYDTGARDAEAAQTQITKVGHPDHRPVLFSADFDVTPAQQAEIDDYLRGCASALGAERVGIYGSYYVVKRCLDNHTARWAWQTAAWSRGQVEPRIHIYQRIKTAVVGGVECDVNEALKLPDFGQHPTPHYRRDDMPLLPATTMPADPNSDPSTWPQTNFDVTFVPGEGWSCVIGVEEWPGRTKDTARGFVLLASWETPHGLVPVTPALAVGGGGIVIYDHAPTVTFTAPPDASGLTLNYGAPGGVTIGT
jgi:hypothetical protein